jgi:glucose-1-phosphate thymidylyltransferase
MKGIILAGGSGSRLHPITHATSKQLLPIYNKPLIYYPMSVLMLAGIKEILIISTPAHIAPLEELFGTGKALGLHISYAVQAKPRGTAEAFLIGGDFIGGDDVCMTLGDNIFYGDNLAKRLEAAKQHVEQTSSAVLFSYYVNNPQDYGVVEYDRGGKALSIEEKPAHPKSNHVITGLGFYPADVVEMAKAVKPSPRGELENTDILHSYMRQGRLNIIALGRGDAWLDAGTPEMLLEASNFVRTLERRQGLKIACLEEIAFNSGLINEAKLEEHIARYKNNEYGDYLVKIKEGKGLRL